jgi:hypothetical protein
MKYVLFNLGTYPERKTILQPLIDFIQEKVIKQESDSTLFVHTFKEVIYRKSGHKRQQHTSM